jgi:hypothetical protein
MKILLSGLFWFTGLGIITSCIIAAGSILSGPPMESVEPIILQSLKEGRLFIGMMAGAGFIIGIFISLTNNED